MEENRNMKEYSEGITIEEAEHDNIDEDDNTAADALFDVYLESDSPLDTEVLENNFKLYMADVGREELLSPEQEIELGLLRINGTSSQRDYAVNELFRRNLRYVIQIAHRYRNNGLEMEDLVQEGNIGLMTAAERFDPKEGCRFTTYATWWITQKIRRAIADMGRTIRLPNHMYIKVNKIKRAERILIGQNREVNPQNLSEITGLSVAEIVEASSYADDTVSLDAIIRSKEYEGAETTLIDMITSDLEGPEEAAASMLLKEEIRNLLFILKERERKIIIYRFGLYGNPPMTLEEIGTIFNVSRERIRQIEASVIKKLKLSKYSAKLKEYY